MSESIPNLWPPEFKIAVQTPLTILRVQAGLLSKVTRGILDGTVETEASKELVQHRLVVIAPAYNGFRYTLLAAVHNPDLPYPAEVRAESLRKEVEHEMGIEATYPRAHSDQEMQVLVQQALRSDKTKAAILSLIAKSNEAIVSPSPGPQDDETHTSDKEGYGSPSAVTSAST